MNADTRTSIFPLQDLPKVLIEPTVKAALAEDLGRAGDVTTLATIDPKTQYQAAINARESGVVAGIDCAQIAFHLIDPMLQITVERPNGALVKAGETVLRLNGSAQSILTAERVALNFMGRLSGIASLTRLYVEQTVGTKAKIACTRKTTPLLRALEKHAVRLGGGSNHRFGLDDAILIKDNHIAACGGVAQALQRAQAYAGHLMPIELEVDRIDQLTEALDLNIAQVIMLDNMDLPTLREAVKLTAGRAILEASGGVNLQTVQGIAQTGVDVISSGALTHSAKVFDFGMDF